MRRWTCYSIGQSKNIINNIPYVKHISFNIFIFSYMFIISIKSIPAGTLFYVIDESVYWQYCIVCSCSSHLLFPLNYRFWLPSHFLCSYQNQIFFFYCLLTQISGIPIVAARHNSELLRCSLYTVPFPLPHMMFLFLFLIWCSCSCSLYAFPDHLHPKMNVTDRYGKAKMELKLKELFGHDMEETGREGGEIDFSQFSDAFERSQLSTVSKIISIDFLDVFSVHRFLIITDIYFYFLFSIIITSHCLQHFYLFGYYLNCKFLKLLRNCDILESPLISSPCYFSSPFFSLLKVLALLISSTLDSIIAPILLSFHLLFPHILNVFVHHIMWQFAQTTAGRMVAASKASGKQLEALKNHS